MKDCELCGLRARMHCESDQASLCWDCDEKVHGANFLVAKHSRSLLCHVCSSPTPWKASGPKLTPTVSVCESCVDCHSRKFERGRDDESQGGNDEEEEEEDDDEVDMFSVDETDSDDGEEEEEDGENQVVPWSFSSSPPPPLAATSSSSEEERFTVSKRTQENADLDSDGETGYYSLANEEATSSGSFRPLKRRRARLTTEDHRSSRRALNDDDYDDDDDDDDDDGQTESRSTAIITSLQRLQKDVITDVDTASATIIGICKLSRDQSR